MISSPDPSAGYRTQSPDTFYEAERLLIDAYRRMTPAEKARRIAEDCHALDRLVLAGIRQRYPNASDKEIRLRLAALRLRRDLAIEVYGRAPDIHGY